jgi:short chain dehydrogenase
MPASNVKATRKATRSVLVTGGSRGLCLAIAQKLTSAGYRTIALAGKKNEGIAEAMAQAERAEQGALHFVPFDLGVIDGISALVGDLRQLRSPFPKSIIPFTDAWCSLALRALLLELSSTPLSLDAFRHGPAARPRRCRGDPKSRAKKSAPPPRGMARAPGERRCPRVRLEYRQPCVRHFSGWPGGPCRGRR